MSSNSLSHLLGYAHSQIDMSALVNARSQLYYDVDEDVDMADADTSLDAAQIEFESESSSLTMQDVLVDCLQFLQLVAVGQIVSVQAYGYSFKELFANLVAVLESMHHVDVTESAWILQRSLGDVLAKLDMGHRPTLPIQVYGPDFLPDPGMASGLLSSPTGQDADTEQLSDSDYTDYTYATPSELSPLPSPMHPTVPASNMWIQHTTLNPVTMSEGPTYSYIPGSWKTTLPSSSSNPLLNGHETCSSLGFNSALESSSPTTMSYGSDDETTPDDSASQFPRRHRHHHRRRGSSSPSTCSITPSESASQLRKPACYSHGKYSATNTAAISTNSTEVDRPLPLFSGVLRLALAMPSSNSANSDTSSVFYSTATSQTSSDASSRFQSVVASQASIATSRSFQTAVSVQSGSGSTQSFHTAQSSSDPVLEPVLEPRSPVMLALGMGTVNAAMLDSLSEMGLTIDDLVDAWLSEK